MTKMTSAHSSRSEDTGVSASGLRPADATSNPGRPENTCSAVGLRSRFWLQTNSTRFIYDPGVAMQAAASNPFHPSILIANISRTSKTAATTHTFSFQRVDEVFEIELRKDSSRIGGCAVDASIDSTEDLLAPIHRTQTRQLDRRGEGGRYRGHQTSDGRKAAAGATRSRRGPRRSRGDPRNLPPHCHQRAAGTFQVLEERG